MKKTEEGKKQKKIIIVLNYIIFTLAGTPITSHAFILVACLYRVCVLVYIN